MDREINDYSDKNLLVFSLNLVSTLNHKNIFIYKSKGNGSHHLEFKGALPSLYAGQSPMTKELYLLETSTGYKKLSIQSTSKKHDEEDGMGSQPLSSLITSFESNQRDTSSTSSLSSLLSPMESSLNEEIFIEDNTSKLFDVDYHWALFEKETGIKKPENYDNVAEFCLDKMDHLKRKLLFNKSLNKLEKIISFILDDNEVIAKNSAIRIVKECEVELFNYHKKINLLSKKSYEILEKIYKFLINNSNTKKEKEKFKKKLTEIDFINIKKHVNFSKKRSGYWTNQKTLNYHPELLKNWIKRPTEMQAIKNGKKITVIFNDGNICIKNKK
jgi:hypothetical protein